MDPKSSFSWLQCSLLPPHLQRSSAFFFFFLGMFVSLPSVVSNAERKGFYKQTAVQTKGQLIHEYHHLSLRDTLTLTTSSSSFQIHRVFENTPNICNFTKYLQILSLVTLQRWEHWCEIIHMSPVDCWRLHSEQHSSIRRKMFYIVNKSHVQTQTNNATHVNESQCCTGWRVATMIVSLCVRVCGINVASVRVSSCHVFDFSHRKLIYYDML